MINHDRWIKSLTIKNNKIDNEANQLDHDRWINTIPQKNPVKKSRIRYIIIWSWIFRFIQ